MQKSRSLSALTLCIGAAFFSLLFSLTSSATPRNVLFITIDDFRPELPAYGATHIQAPQMTRLSDEGLTFNRAYVQQAICQPARANVLTGARPDTTRIYTVFGGGWPTFRTTMGAVDTLPSVFKDNNYWTASYGKIFHHVDNPSWTESNSFYTTADLYQDPVNRAIAGDVNARPPWENYIGGNEENYMDAKVAAAAVTAIRARAADGEPFFIAAGFWKPHLPFTAPSAYWDMYDRATLPIATGADALPVQGALPTAFYDPFSGELGTYRGGRPPFVGQTAATQQALADGTFTTNQQTGADYGIITVNGTHIYPEDWVRGLTHGYYASTSFIDAQIGKLLAALEDPNDDGSTADSILNNTIIVLWGDHGMHVGQHGSWPKHTNMDIATRIPFIIHHPDMPAGTQGQMTDALMESVDIMPTLLEMANLPIPSTHTMEGRSLVPLLADPTQTWKTAAFSQYPKEVPMNSGIWYMGYAMRTDTHSYVQWRSMQATDANPISLANRNFSITNTVAYEELYDMVNDPKQNENIGGTPSVRPLMDAYKAMLNTALSTGYANTQQVGSTTPTAPEAQAVAFTGGTAVGDTLTAHYLFADANGDADQSSTVEWVRADAFTGPYSTVVGTSPTYTLQAADTGKFVKLRVTPQADAAPATGTAVLSATAVVAGTGFNDGSDLPAPESAIYEAFDYAAGTLSSSSAGGRGWASGWWGDPALSFSGNSGSSAADVTWSNLPTGYNHTPAGRAGSNGANSNNPYRPFSAGQTIDLAQNGSRYFSYLYRHNGSAATFEQRFHAGTAEVFKLQINGSGSLALITADETNMALLTLAANTDYVVLGRLQSVASGNDTLAVSIYKSGDTVPTEAPVFTASVNLASSAVIDRMFFGNPFNGSNTGNSFWDEFHLDATFAAVVGTATGDGGSTYVPPFLIESFDYAAGGLSSSNAGGSGWGGGWFGDAALSFGSNSGAAAAAKTWNVPTGYAHDLAGLSATNGSNGNTPYRALGAGAQIDLAGETAYFSFLFRHDSSSMFECSFNAGTTEAAKLQVDSGGQLRLIGTDFYATGFNLNANEDYLITGKIVGNPSGNDTLQVSVFPASGSVPEGEPSFTYSVTLTSSAVIDRLKVGIPVSTATVGTYWDELLLGTTWDSVVGVAAGPGDPDPVGTAPVASLVGLSGGRNSGDTLQGHYTYSDSESDVESGTTFRWLVSDTEAGSYTAISGASAQTYVLAAGDLDKFIKFEVTPNNQAALEPTGVAALSAPILIGSNLSYGLQAHIEFEDANLASGLADSSGNNNGASSATGTLIARDGGQALQLNGSSNKFSLPFDGTIFDNGLSVAFWAQGDDVLMPKNSALAWAIKTTGGNQDNLILAPGYGNSNQMLIRMGHDGSSQEESAFTPATADIKGDWTHWAFVKNIPAGTIEVYKNAVLVDTVTGKFAPIYVENHWATGGGWVVGEIWDGYYAGAVDDYRIYDRQITGTEVAQIVAASGGVVLPSASIPSLTGTAEVGGTLTASYNFTYPNGSEGSSTFQWYRADAEGGTYAAIAGATATTYNPTAADDGKWLRFGVTPIGQDLVAGSEVFSAPVSIGVAAPEPSLILQLTFDAASLADSSPSARAVTGAAGFATVDGRSYATLNGVDQSITAPILGSFPEGLSVAFWTLAQDGVDGMPKNTALGWARQGGTTGSLGDGVVLGFGWNNGSNSLVRVGRENNLNDDISIPEVTNWLNTWVHWTVVKDPTEGTLTVYRDGLLYSTASGRTIVPAFESQSWATGAGYRIGRYFDVYYKGFIDDYRIYDGALDAATVQTIYQQGAATGPTAFNVTVTGTFEVGNTLTGTYDFTNPNGTEGTSTFQWYRGNTLGGVFTAIPGATALTYQASASDSGRYLRLGVTPVGGDTTAGVEALSAPVLIGTFTDRSLANTLRRITNDQALNVVFFGGSITDGVGQNNGLSWRTRTENWFSTTYPGVTFNFTNASISGTSSEFGVFRTDRHVLSAQPDLVFVEFAVNDIEQPSDTRTRQTMEGIVRKIRIDRPNCDIVFVYTTTRANAVSFYEQGQLPSRTLVHEQVATHYGITTVDAAAALVAHKQVSGYPYRIEYGEPGAFDPTKNHYLPDHVHPSNLGHQVYGDAVQATLETLLGIAAPAALVAHPMPSLFSGYDMSSARIIDHTHPDVSYGSGWAVQALGIGGGGRTDNFLVTSSASTASPIDFAFSGPELGVYYHRQTTGGQIAWDVDSGASSAAFPFYHETLTSFTSFAMLSSDLGQGNHLATVTPQAYNGNESLVIAGWLVLGEATSGEPPAYTTWADTTFAHLAGGASHPDAALTADPDADGLSNLLEYALNLDPLVTDTSGLPVSAFSAQSSHLTLTFQRARAELTYEVLASTTLAPDSWTVIATDPGTVGNEVTVEDSEAVSENPKRFLRLRVTE